MDTVKELSVYRFHDQIAINLPTGTIYLTAETAKRLGLALARFRVDIRNCPFSQSPIGTIKIEEV